LLNGPSLNPGIDLTAMPQPAFTQVPVARGRFVSVPDRLPRLDVGRAFRQVRLPLHLNWSTPGRVFDLSSRSDRARVYEIVLQEGRPADILAYIDGALLLDVWDDLVLPRAVRSAWTPLIESVKGRYGTVRAAGGTAFLTSCAARAEGRELAGDPVFEIPLL
jgi:hypothetical protein